MADVTWRVPEQKIPVPTGTEPEPGQHLAVGVRRRLAHRVEDLVLIEVRVEAMMLPVGQLPHVEGTEEEAVEDGADGVVEQRVLGEGAVSAVVSDDEHRREERALHGPVEQHRCGAQRSPRKLLQPHADNQRRRHQHNVPQGVVQRRANARLEAPLGQRVLDLGDAGDVLWQTVLFRQTDACRLYDVLLVRLIVIANAQFDERSHKQPRTGDKLERIGLHHRDDVHLRLKTTCHHYSSSKGTMLC